MAGNAYIVNCTPFTLNCMVNNGMPTRLGAISPTTPANIPGTGTIGGNVYVVPYSSGLNPDQISGTNNPSGSRPNSLYVSGKPYTGGQTPVYKISVNMNTVPLTDDVYLWVFIDTVYAADSAGQSQGFTISKIMTVAAKE